MERRQDRYDVDETNKKMTRTERHKNLYNEINSKIGFSDISSYETGTKIDLSNLDFGSLQREEYQKVKDYKNIINKDPDPEVEELPKKQVREKNFDINAVLEEAKKNRKADDELEKKRNLSGDESVLSSLNKKYLHTKDFDDEDSDELKELIDTIASKTLVDDIKDEEEKELLSELLATTIDIKLEQELSNEEINKLYESDDDNEEEEQDVTDELDGNIDTSTLENSFFTHSVELKKDDLIDDNQSESDEYDEEDEPDKKGIVKIAIVIIILLILVLFITFFILKEIGF